MALYGIFCVVGVAPPLLVWALDSGRIGREDADAGAAGLVGVPTVFVVPVVVLIVCSHRLPRGPDPWTTTWLVLVWSVCVAPSMLESIVYLHAEIDAIRHFAPPVIGVTLLSAVNPSAIGRPSVGHEHGDEGRNDGGT